MCVSQLRFRSFANENALELCFDGWYVLRLSFDFAVEWMFHRNHLHRIHYFRHIFQKYRNTSFNKNLSKVHLIKVANLFCSIVQTYRLHAILLIMICQLWLSHNIFICTGMYYVLVVLVHFTYCEHVLEFNRDERLFITHIYVQYR